MVFYVLNFVSATYYSVQAYENSLKLLATLHESELKHSVLESQGDKVAMNAQNCSLKGFFSHIKRSIDSQGFRGRQQLVAIGGLALVRCVLFQTSWLFGESLAIFLTRLVYWAMIALLNHLMTTSDLNAVLIFGAALLLAIATYGEMGQKAWRAYCCEELVLAMQLGSLLTTACERALFETRRFLAAFADELNLHQEISGLATDTKEFEYGYAVVDLSEGQVATLARYNLPFIKVVQQSCQHQAHRSYLLSQQHQQLSVESRQQVFTPALSLEKLLDFVCLARHEEFDGETLRNLLKSAIFAQEHSSMDSRHLFTYTFQPVQQRTQKGCGILRIRAPTLTVSAYSMQSGQEAPSKVRVYLRIMNAISDTPTTINDANSALNSSVQASERRREVRFGAIDVRRFSSLNARSASHNNIMKRHMSLNNQIVQPRIRRSNSLTEATLEIIKQPELRPLPQFILKKDSCRQEKTHQNYALEDSKEDYQRFFEQPRQPQTNQATSFTKQQRSAQQKASYQTYVSANLSPQPIELPPPVTAIPQVVEEVKLPDPPLPPSHQQSAFGPDSSSVENSLASSRAQSHKDQTQSRKSKLSYSMLSRAQLPLHFKQVGDCVFNEARQRRNSQSSAPNAKKNATVLTLVPSKKGGRSSSESGSQNSADSAHQQFDETIKGELSRIGLESRKNQSSLLQLENNQKVISHISREFGRNSRFLPVFKSLKPISKSSLLPLSQNSDPKSKNSDYQVLSQQYQVKHSRISQQTKLSKHDEDSKSSESVKTTVTQRLNQSRTFVYKIIHDLRHPVQGMITSVEDLKGFLTFPKELRAKFFSGDFDYTEHAMVRKAVATSKILIDLSKKQRKERRLSPMFPLSQGRHSHKHQSLVSLRGESSKSQPQIATTSDDQLHDQRHSEKKQKKLVHSTFRAKQNSRTASLDDSMVSKVSEVSSESSDKKSSQQPSQMQICAEKSIQPEKRIKIRRRGERSLEIRRRVFERIKKNFIPFHEDYPEKLAELRVKFHAISLEQMALGGESSTSLRPQERRESQSEQENKSPGIQSGVNFAIIKQIAARHSSKELSFARKRSSSMGVSSGSVQAIGPRQKKSSTEVFEAENTRKFTFGQNLSSIFLQREAQQLADPDNNQSSDSSLLKPVDYMIGSRQQRQDSQLSLGSIQFSQANLQMDISPSRLSQKQINNLTSPLMASNRRSLQVAEPKYPARPRKLTFGPEKSRNSTNTNLLTEVSLDQSASVSQPVIKVNEKNMRTCLQVIEILATDRGRLLKQLQKAVKCTDRCVEMLDTMETQAQMTMSLLKDLMTQAQLNNNTFSFENAYFDLLALVKGILTMMKPQTRAQNVTLVGPVVTSNNSRIFFRQIYADVRRYTQIIVNFVSNAIKFTRKDGQVTVLLHALDTEEIKEEPAVSALLADDCSPARRESVNALPDKEVDSDPSEEGKGEDAVGTLHPALQQAPTAKHDEKMVEYRIKFKLTVRDTGIGIAPEDKAKLFKHFGKLEDKRNQNAQGIGLGLAICHEIITKSGGTISIDSEVDRGTDFIIILETKSRCSKSELERQLLHDSDNESELRSTSKNHEALFSSSSQQMTSPRDTTEANQPYHQRHCGLFQVQEEFEESKTYAIDFTYGQDISAPLQVPQTQSIVEECSSLDQRLSRSLNNQSLAHPLEEQLRNSDANLIFSESVKNQEVHNQCGNQEDLPQMDVISETALQGKLFIANDNGFVLNTMRDIAKPYFTLIDTAPNGQETVEMVCSKPPSYYDIVLLDIDMPYVQGDEACRQIHAYFRRTVQSQQRKQDTSFVTNGTNEEMHDPRQNIETPRNRGLPKIYAVTAISDPLKIDQLRQIGFDDVFEHLTVDLLKRFMSEAGLQMISPRQRQSSSAGSALVQHRYSQFDPSVGLQEGNDQGPLFIQEQEDLSHNPALQYIQEEEKSASCSQESSISISDQEECKEDVTHPSKPQRKINMNASISNEDSSSINASLIESASSNSSNQSKNQD